MESVHELSARLEENTRQRNEIADQLRVANEEALKLSEESQTHYAEAAWANAKVHAMADRCDSSSLPLESFKELNEQAMFHAKRSHELKKKGHEEFARIDALRREDLRLRREYEETHQALQELSFAGR